MSEFTYEEYTASEYRYRKRILVTIFSQPFPLNSGKYRTADKAIVEDKEGSRLDVDAAYLKEVFKTIHYPENAEVRIKNRRRKKDVMEYITDLGNSKDCIYYDSFFFVFLTYLTCETHKTGDPDNEQQPQVYQDERIHLEDGLCPLQEIYDEVKKVEAMRMKPKIFLVQADDVSLLHPEQFTKGGEEVTKRLKIPQDADRLIIVSDIPQRVPQNYENPSFMIRAFGETLIENSQARLDDRQDLLSLTTTMNGKVVAMIDNLKKKGIIRANDMKVPLVTSTLTKLVRI